MAGKTDSQRSAYLLDGRRVIISDLLEAGLFAVGDVLQFERPRLHETYRAVVTAAGTLALDGGQEFGSPSGAAVVAADVKSLDGWHAWTVAKSGRSLDSLRQQLLAQAAAGETAGKAGLQGDTHQRYEWLNEARTRADADNPVRTSVRDLLARWDAKADGSTLYQRIDNDLANHGLTTSPGFRKVSMDTVVRLITPEQEAGESAHSPAGGADENVLEIGLTVGNLKSALNGVASVSPNASFDEAITLMLLNGYSQLAVLSGSHTLRGAVTWQSIAYARNSSPHAKFAAAIIRHARHATTRNSLKSCLTWKHGTSSSSGTKGTKSPVS